MNTTILRKIDKPCGGLAIANLRKMAVFSRLAKIYDKTFAKIDVKNIKSEFSNVRIIVIIPRLNDCQEILFSRAVFNSSAVRLVLWTIL